jgi:hypothetical protein
MVGQSAVETLRAYGYDARSDGLGNVQARVWQWHADDTQTASWVAVPTDPAALLGWLANALRDNARGRVSVAGDARPAVRALVIAESAS